MAIIDLHSSAEPEYFSTQVAFARRWYRHGMPERDSPGSVSYHVVAGGTETCLPGYRVERSDFPFWGIEYVASGRGTVTFGGETLELRPGAVFAYSPGRPHRITADSIYPLKKNFIDFVPAEHPEDTLLAGIPDGRILHSHSPEALKRSFDDLAEFGPREGDDYDIICSSLTELLIMKIRQDATEAELADSASYRSFRRCRDLMDNRFLEFSGIDAVAAAANMDVSYLCRLFKRYGDETAYRRLSRLRMNHAAGLLVREGMSVSRTASELGYEDAFTFSRRFKTVMGRSPQEFARENYRARRK